MPDVVREQLTARLANLPKIVESGRHRPKHPHCFTWPDGTRYAPDWATHEFTRVVKRSGLPHCSLHDLRRSFSTLAQRAGVERAVVKDLGGWSTVGDVEKHYTRIFHEAT